MPKAFVIMPFSADFNEIYNLFIASTLSDVGYEVFRADDIVSQRNILDDIIASISDSDLIVADLTGSNSNVYYELGIAHAFGKPVILLTQSISDLPFDLRSYRVVQYNTHFAVIGEATKRLLQLADAAINGKLPFRSPVTDFGSTTNIKLNEEVKTVIDDDLGFLDHVVRMQDGLKSMTATINQIGVRMQEENKNTGKITEEINNLAKSNDSEKPKRFKKLLSEFAVFQQDYAEFLKESNDKIESNINDTFTSLEFVISFKAPTTIEEREALTNMLSSLSVLENNSQSSLDSFTNLITTMEALPKMEKSLNKAIDQVIIQLTRYTGYTQQVIALSSKSIAIARKLLES